VRSGGSGRVPRVRGNGRRQERDARVQGYAGRAGAGVVVVRGPAGGQQHYVSWRGADHRRRRPCGQRHVRVRGRKSGWLGRVQLYDARNTRTVRGGGRFVSTGPASASPAGHRAGRFGVLCGAGGGLRGKLPVAGGKTPSAS